MKLSDTINRILQNESSPESSKKQNKSPTTTATKTYYSFEYFPPKTEQGLENLIDRIDRMAKTNPLWVDITWNAGGVTSDITLDLSSHI
jgi:5,10-methylenetetrahydrofolate reductase